MQTSTEQDILSGAREYVREEMSKDASGHDWWHIHRVATMAKRLATECGADVFVCELAALLHDVGDYKLRGPSNEAESAIARRWMESHGVQAGIVDHICSIIDSMSYSTSLKNTGIQSGMKTTEGQCVQDADRLDAIGAIGVARTFAYGGSKGQPMHDPELEPVTNQTKEQYRTSRTSSVNHFHEKLLLLKGLMNTEPAKRLAEQRHEYMKQFLEQFHAEWNGER
jgi:uncharacterized protein